MLKSVGVSVSANPFASSLPLALTLTLPLFLDERSAFFLDDRRFQLVARELHAEAEIAGGVPLHAHSIDDFALHSQRREQVEGKLLADDLGGSVLVVAG